MLDFQLGRIINVDDKNNVVYVNSFESGSNIPVELDNPLSLQVMPKIGSLVLFVRYGMNVTKIIKIWENNPDLLRKNSGRLLPGEIQIQSEGGGYIYLNNNGDVSIVDGGMRNIFKIIRKKFQILIQATEILFQTFNGLEIRHTKSGEYEITKKDPRTKEIKAKIVIDKDGNTYIDSQTIYLGKNANDENKRKLFGDIVTSGPYGTFPICPVTGKPITGSSTIKGAS